MTVNHPYQESHIPGWMPLAQCRRIYDQIISSNAKTCVEMGIFLGRTSHVITSALQALGGDRRLISIDWFRRTLTPEYCRSPRITKMLSQYPNSAQHYFHNPEIGSIRDGFEWTLRQFPFMNDFLEVREHPFRDLDLGSTEVEFALIDGAHSYEETLNNFEKLDPHLPPGGIICFDDVIEQFPGVLRFVDELRSQETGATSTFGELAFYTKNALPAGSR